MKREKNYTIAAILLVLLMAYGGSASCQTVYHPKPVVDETFVTVNNKKTFKIATANDKVYNYLFDTFFEVYTNIKYTYKKDRAGQYWEKTFTFPINVYDTVIKKLEYKFLK